MISEKRKLYLKEYREKNRKKLTTYLRGYLLRTGKKYSYHRPKTKRQGEYFGTSGLGRKYEKLALRLLLGSTQEDSFHSHWDINWMGKRIEVKMRNRIIKKSYKFTFKPKNKADYCLLFCVDENKIHKILFIPFPKTKSIAVGHFSSKYDQYKIVTTK